MFSDNRNSVVADSYDYDKFDRQSQENEQLKEIVERSTGTFPEFLPLVEDIFNGLLKPTIRFDDVSPEYETNKLVMQQLAETKEFQGLRNSGTISNQFLSGIAVSAIASEIEQKLYNEMQVSNQKSSELRRLAEGLQIPDELLNQAQELEEDMADAIRYVARQGIKKAEEAVTEAEAVIQFCNAFGTQGPQDSEALDNDALQSVQKDIRGNKLFMSILKMLGRMNMTMERSQKFMAEGTIVPVGIELGGNLYDMAEDELINLAVPEYEMLFWNKYITNTLSQIRRKDTDPKSEGPIIIVVDESGSMDGPRRFWASAIELCYLMIGMKQKRPVRVVHFGTTCLREDFDPNQYDLHKVMNCVQHFYNGGTDFNVWQQPVYNGIRGSESFKKADVLFITDGVGSVNNETINRWKIEKKELEFKCIGLAIGVNQTKEIDLFSDLTLKITDKEIIDGDDTKILETIFSI